MDSILTSEPLQKRHWFAAMNHIFQLALANSFNLRSQCREFALGRPSCTVIHILHSSPAGRTWVDMSLQRLSHKKNSHVTAFSDCFLVVWWHRQQRLFLRVQNISRLHLVPQKSAERTSASLRELGEPWDREGIPKRGQPASDHLCSPVALPVRLLGSHQAATGAVRTSHVVERKRWHYMQDCYDSASVSAPVEV